MSGYFEGLIGTRLGGYVVRRMIARGGMGVVYEGYQESLDRSVAIKILYPHLSDDPGFRERFQREARALAQLTHPHIVRVIDFDVSEKYVYMIMELVDGHSLRDELIQLRERGETMSIQRSLEILQAVGMALTFAHERGFVHRDVKPGNILINSEGQVFLTDFGLVKLDDVAGATATGAVMGTPEYMAPEQFLATSEAGPAADQYALAVVAYEMLVGRVPFQAQTPVGLLHKHLEEEPPSINTIDSRIPPTVEPVIRRGLAKDPTTRYPTVTGFVNDLQDSTTIQLPTIATAETLAESEKIAAPAPVASPPVPPPSRTVASKPGTAPPPAAPPPVATQASSRPGWLKWVLIGVIPLLLIGGVGAAMLSGGGDDDADPTPTVLAVVDATSTTADEANSTATTEAAVDPTATETEAVSPTETTPPTATSPPVQATETRVPIVVTRPIQNAVTPTSIIIQVPTPATDDGEFVELVSSDFDTDADLAIWAVATDRPEFTTQIVDGHYVVDILSNDPNGYSVFSYPQGATNLADGAQAVRVLASGDGGAGIMMRRDASEGGTGNMYICQISNTQEFHCAKQIDGQWTDVVARQYSEAIIPNDYNIVTVGATGNYFSMQINDTIVAEWTDDSLTSGAWGIYVERDGAGASMSAKYDAVVIVQD